MTKKKQTKKTAAPHVAEASEPKPRFEMRVNLTIEERNTILAPLADFAANRLLQSAAMKAWILSGRRAREARAAFEAAIDSVLPTIGPAPIFNAPGEAPATEATNQ